MGESNNDTGDGTGRRRERDRDQTRVHADVGRPGDERDEAAGGRTVADGSGSGRECHRRDCADPAAFVVLERYQEETGHGAVEATADLCLEHTAEERPANLDGVYEDYVFRVEPIPESLASES